MAPHPPDGLVLPTTPCRRRRSVPWRLRSSVCCLASGCCGRAGRPGTGYCGARMRSSSRSASCGAASPSFGRQASTAPAGSEGLSFLVLWGGMFVLLGLYFVAGRFVVRAVASRRCRYAVTDRRVLAAGGWTGRRIRSEYLSSVPPPIMIEREDGSG